MVVGELHAGNDGWGFGGATQIKDSCSWTGNRIQLVTAGLSVRCRFLQMSFLQLCCSSCLRSLASHVANSSSLNQLPSASRAGWLGGLSSGRRETPPSVCSCSHRCRSCSFYRFPLHCTVQLLFSPRCPPAEVILQAFALANKIWWFLYSSESKQ